MKKNRRRIVMISKKFQVALILKFVFLNILVMALFGVFLYMFLNSEVEANLYSAHVTYQNMKDMLFPIIITLVILNIVISSIVISVFVLYASFRIAGPVYRFDVAIKEINQGNLKPLLTLRENDELYAFSETLKEMAINLKGIFGNSKSLLAEIKNINDEKKYQELGGKIEELETLLAGIKD